MNEDFKKVAQIYLSNNAKPLDIEEYMYRGCKMWVFRRAIKRWRPTAQGIHRWRKEQYDYNKMPEEEREYYDVEFWMGISDYFLKYSCEFEETVEKVIGESMSKEEAKFRLENYISEDYAEYISLELIP